MIISKDNERFHLLDDLIAIVTERRAPLARIALADVMEEGTAPLDAQQEHDLFQLEERYEELEICKKNLDLCVCLP